MSQRALGRALKRVVGRIREVRTARRLRREHVGVGSRLSASVQVYGWKNVRIGRHTVVSEDTWLNALNCPRDEPTIVIGDFCFIGRRNFFSAAALIEIGDYCLTGIDCHFLGADHLHPTPFAPYTTTGTTTGGRVVLGANCWLGSSVTVLKDVEIGFGSIIGAGSVVTRSIPPCSVAVGNPARVVKRFDSLKTSWVPTQELTPEAEAQLPTPNAYLQRLRDSHPFIRLPVRAIGQEFGDL